MLYFCLKVKSIYRSVVSNEVTQRNWFPMRDWRITHTMPLSQDDQTCLNNKLIHSQDFQAIEWHLPIWNLWNILLYMNSYSSCSKTIEMCHCQQFFQSAPAFHFLLLHISLWASLKTTIEENPTDSHSYLQYNPSHPWALQISHYFFPDTEI